MSAVDTRLERGPNEINLCQRSSSLSQDHVVPDGRFVDYSRFVFEVLT